MPFSMSRIALDNLYNLLKLFTKCLHFPQNYDTYQEICIIWSFTLSDSFTSNSSTLAKTSFVEADCDGSTPPKREGKMSHSVGVKGINVRK